MLVFASILCRGNHLFWCGLTACGLVFGGFTIVDLCWFTVVVSVVSIVSVCVGVCYLFIVWYAY